MWKLFWKILFLQMTCFMYFWRELCAPTFLSMHFFLLYQLSQWTRILWVPCGFLGMQDSWFWFNETSQQFITWSLIHFFLCVAKYVTVCYFFDSYGSFPCNFGSFLVNLVTFQHVRSILFKKLFLFSPFVYQLK